MNRLDYSIVIATRNRPEALRLSIPRMLGQSRKPSQIIVIDSSDDHEPVRETVESAMEGQTIDWSLQHSEKGLTRQRNLGLAKVAHPIVFFPDDDSIWYPDTAEQKMAVYDQDVDQKVAAVCGSEAKTAPDGFFESESAEAKAPAYSMNTGDKLKQRFGYAKSQVEQRVAQDPAKVLGRSFYGNFETTPWHTEMDVVPVEWMTGFRMSFRTDAIRAVGFDEALTEYSLFEDIDASFAAWKKGGVVGARQARVFHYKSPEQRGNGRKLGATQILNKAYVIAKHSDPGHEARKAMRPFTRLKITQYLTACRHAFGRERFQGAVEAAKLLDPLLEAKRDEVETRYREILAKLDLNQVRAKQEVRA